MKPCHPLRPTAPRRRLALLPLGLGLGLLVWLTGCAHAPIGADRVATRIAYQQVDAFVLNAGQLSAYTVSQLHRFHLDQLAAAAPHQALPPLHQKALETGERDLLFALAEVSYLAGDQLRRSVKPWDQRDARDYYLGAAVYAGLFLFGDAKDRPGPYDRRFRTACDLYNYGLGWGLTERKDTNAVVRLESGRRRLPVGTIELRFDPSAFPWSLDQFDRFLLADQFSVRGLSMRIRDSGVGAPLIALGRIDPSLRFQRAAPATVFLAVPGTLKDLGTGQAIGSLQLFSPFSQSTVTVGDQVLPLESDLTAPRAYALNQSFAWQAGRLMFFSGDRALKNQLLPTEPYRPGRVPVVLVHGTFSTPVPWTEMVNTLYADPVLRKRCQFYLYMYSSSKPLVISAAEFRAELMAMVQKLDPEGHDAALRQMVVVGHSQGGLMAKMTATDSGDQLWRVLSDQPLEALHLSATKEAEIRRLAFLQPLPFVTRTVFISTPHRGSYQNRNFVQNLGRRLVDLPAKVMETTTDILLNTEGVKLPEQFKAGVATSLDGMSVHNPLMLKLADIPTVPGVPSHSIISVKGDGDYRQGKDGVVAYASAHVDHAASEFIVRSGHSCQTNPQTIEEVRRILHQHLGALPHLP